MSKRLRGGIPRRYADHRRSDARAYRAAYLALEASHGPLVGEARDLAADVAELKAEWQETRRDLKAARVKRSSGRGRRPSEHGIIRLQKRAGLARGDYRQAREDFLALVGRQRRPDQPADLIARRRAREAVGG